MFCYNSWPCNKSTNTHGVAKLMLGRFQPSNALTYALLQHALYQVERELIISATVFKDFGRILHKTILNAFCLNLCYQSYLEKIYFNNSIALQCKFSLITSWKSFHSDLVDWKALPFAGKFWVIFIKVCKKLVGGFSFKTFLDWDLPSK